jgi:cytochrome c oxidase cbb3-type subunit 2
MPSYPWLFKNKLTGKDTQKKLTLFAKFGVPYTADQIESAQDDVAGRYEIEAVIAYLQSLGKKHSVYSNKR